VAERVLIAIVDDEKSVRQALGRLVVSAGLEAEVFSSAEEFLQSCTDHHPDCLILDLRLRGMDGLELQSRLAAAHHSMPIIFISAHDDPGPRAQALNAGATAFLSKPFNDKVLLEAIHLAVNAG